jgi:GH35 family endo-1,4-beta-xylanase
MPNLRLLWWSLAAAGSGLAAESAPDEFALLAGADARIRQHRTAPLTVEVRDRQGRAIPGARVHVEHTRHLFFFGAGFDSLLLPRPEETEVDRRHRDAFLRLFNYSTVHLYWAGYEPRRGEHQDSVRQQYIAWLKEHGLVARGHPIHWNHPAGVPRWLADLDPEPAALRPLLAGRLQQLSRTVLPGLRDADVFNELVQWHRFKNVLTRQLEADGKVPFVTQVLHDTKRLNPHLLTVVNDYDATPAFPQLLRELLQAGAPIDIIGQQSHMHSGTWSAAKTWGVLERLSALQRPVLFTELSVLSGHPRKIDWNGNPRFNDWTTAAELEPAQADYLERFFRLVFSHPSAIGIVLWNYTDRRSWMGAPVGLLRKDGTPKPSFDRLDALINREWRTRGEFATDAGGRVVLPAAFAGSYRITVGTETLTSEHRPAAPLRLQFTAPLAPVR